MERPDFFTLKNGEKVKLPFSKLEYNQRVNKLRTIMNENNIDMVILTSMHNIAYYTGFIYCAFGRPYGCVITKLIQLLELLLNLWSIILNLDTLKYHVRKTLYYYN